MEELRDKFEHQLWNAVAVVDAAVTLRERVKQNTKHVTHLRALAERAARVTSSFKVSELAYLLHAQKLSHAAIATLSLAGNKQEVIQEYRKLQDVIQKELARFGQGSMELVAPFQTHSHISIPDRIVNIKEYQRHQNLSEHHWNHPTTPEHHRKRTTSPARARGTRLRSTSPRTSKSIKILKPFDEKYPESFSRDSLVDFSTVFHLPPVPEDVFKCFNNAPPQRSASLCSVKSLRRVNLRFSLNSSAISEEDECMEEAEFKTHDFNTTDSPSSSEQDLGMAGTQPGRKLRCLGNIKEEVSQERETILPSCSHEEDY